MPRTIGASVLPNDRLVDRLAGRFVPHNRRFALIGDADGRNVCGCQSRLRQHIAAGVQRGLQQVRSLMFNPTGLRIMLGEFLLRAMGDRHVRIEQDGPR